MKNSGKPARYQAMLLTFWEERNQTSAQEPVWRFRVQELYTRQKYGFATLEELVAFLQSKMARANAEPKQNEAEV
jgi:hypothetical protein